MLNRLRTRLRALLRKSEMEHELDEELRYHVERQTEQNIRLGMSPEEARIAARKAFGGVEQAKERSRDARGMRWIEDLWQDLRYGARMLLKNPGFTLISVLTLALGIGANSAIFSVVNAVLLNPFAYPDTDRIMNLSTYELAQPEYERGVSYPNFLDWQKQQSVFTHLAAEGFQSFHLTGGGEPEIVNGAPISPETFSLLEVPPYLGRVFTAEDNRLDSAPKATLSYAFWQRRFGGESSVIGRTMLLDNQVYTIIGVMPPRFKFGGADVWVPIGLFANESPNTVRAASYHWVVGRLKPGVRIEQARAEMNAISARLAKQYPESSIDVGVRVTPLSEKVTREIRPSLLALMGAVVFVLLIACANVANLLIARAAAREKELAIRAALGAGRLRLVRQLLLESLSLATLGGLAGFLLARWGVELLLKLAPNDLIPGEAVIGVDLQTLGFTLLLTLLTTLICSLLPALQFSKGAVLDGLKEGARLSTSASGNQRTRGALVTLEVALSVILLIGAGLLIKSFARLQQVEFGFKKESLLAIDLKFSPGKYDQPQLLENFFRDVLERVNATPGVESAAFMNGAPFTGSGVVIPLVREGQSFSHLQELSDRHIRYYVVYGDLVNALGSPPIAGRGFTPRDTATSEPVAIINQAAAEKYFPGENPLGKRIRLGVPENLIQPDMPEGFKKLRWLTVVGVVKNLRESGSSWLQEFQAAGYTPLAQAPPIPVIFNISTLLVRSSKDPVPLVNTIRRQIHSVDPDLPLANVATMEDLIDDSFKPQRFNALLMGLFAALALLLAVVGLYGVLSYTVAQRRHEIGIRMALGAQSHNIVFLVLKQGLRLTILGVAIGLAGAFGLTRLIERLLFGVSATDPLTFILIALLLTLVALLACWMPARRAARVDPLVALRTD
ncbi:MAG TPA: ABC transporter permease [Blastocatellia bacterium]|jgi:putative ABC transport system permease protein|nr:ABC transporter permease [Blastocatellia bacterium]